MVGCSAKGVTDMQLVEVEATRDLSQTIVHVDMDAFVSRQEKMCADFLVCSGRGQA